MQASSQGPTVYMLDGMWPEFDSWIHAHRSANDRLFIPLDGKRAGKPQYAWSTDGFGDVRTHPMLTVWRALASRRIPGQGAARQRLAITFRQRLARAYAGRLTSCDRHIVITQELLPYVWELGVLESRSFDVLMTSLPMQEVQQRLDAAWEHHPDSKTLRDFRADEDLLALEERALMRARRIITPHAAVAELFEAAVELPWHLPAQQKAQSGTRIVFPAITVGRKGAFELREAARTLQFGISLIGAIIEGPEFWSGIRIEQIQEDDPSWLDGVAVVVLPSWLENRPFRLLLALAAGVPVVATPACGLRARPGLVLVPPGDTHALCAALRPFAGKAAFTSY